MFKKSVETNTEAQESMSASVGDLADCVVNNPALIGQLEALGFKSKNPGGMTYREAMICSQIASAVRGDLDSYKAVMSTMMIGGMDEKKSPLAKFVEGSGNMPIKKRK